MFTDIDYPSQDNKTQLRKNFTNTLKAVTPMHRWRSRGAGGSKAPPPKQKFGRAELLQMLLQMYLTIPVTSATSESTFSALRLLKNYLRSTMKQDCLNNCLLMHCHKLTTGTLYTAKVAKRFACANEQCKGHFGKFM